MSSYLPSSRRHYAVAFFSLVMVLGMVLAACGGGSSTNPTTQNGSGAKTLHVLPAPGQPIVDLFNPYFDANHGGEWGAAGLMYEQLWFINGLTGQSQPWLASSYKFSSDNMQLTFNLRQGVKWSDGQPFTSQDVVFTFNLLKQNAALDINGVAPFYKSVSAPDDNTVVFTLTQPNTTALYYIGGQVRIVPQHVWSKISGDPAKYANDKDPVVIGPYKLQSWNSNIVTYVVNPDYWGTKPQVPEIQVVSIKDNTTAITDMISGKLDWMGVGWNPDLDAQFTQKDPQHNHTFFPASNVVMLYLNLQKAPFNNVLVRKAISTAINRDQLPQGVAQYAKPATPTGIVTPTFNDWLAPQYQNLKFQYSVQQAQSYLQQAGFTKGPDGFYRDASGKELTIPVNVVTGWSDWDQDVQFIVNDLKAAGINASVNSMSQTAFVNAITTGNYSASICWTNAGPSPYYGLQAVLESAYSAKPGQTVSGTNFERWDASTSNGLSALTDKYIQQYQQTLDPNVQKQAIQGLEKVMVEQLPAIPLTVNVNWDEYTTKNYVGWPDQSNPYDFGSPFQVPDFENVLLHLKAA
jgi:peptide/nickel transport system substrate-binding protein